MSKILTIATALFATSAFATGVTPPTATSVNAAICNTVSTSATTFGPGTSTSNAAVANGASATAGANKGAVNTYVNGLANNASTGAGVGAAKVVGISAATAASSSKEVNQLGTVKTAGSTSADAAAKIKVGTNQAGTALSASAANYTVSGSLVKVDGVTTGKVEDTKAAQSVVEVTGKGFATTDAKVTVNASAVANQGVVRPVKSCSIGHDINGGCK